MSPFLDTPALIRLANQASAGGPCACQKYDLQGWSNWPVGYREEDFRNLGTLAPQPAQDCTLDEYHPQATTYWCAKAPIAPRYYPYNQASVWECIRCQRAYLRHNDDGAYHVAPRIRRLQADLIVDAPASEVAP